MKTTKLMTGLALVASTLLTTAPVLAQDSSTSTASLTIEPGVRNIDSVPTLNFDKVTVSGNIEVTSISNPNAIKLSDYTGSLSGWTLNVKRSAFQTTDGNKLDDDQDNATLKLTGGSFGQSDDVADAANDTVTAAVELGTVDTNATVAKAGTGTGTGATTINYTAAELELPDAIAKGKVKAGTYSSTLIWTLTDAPTN